MPSPNQTTNNDHMSDNNKKTRRRKLFVLVLAGVNTIEKIKSKFKQVRKETNNDKDQIHNLERGK